MYPTYRAARLLPLGALLLTALGGCRDNPLPTAPLPAHPSFVNTIGPVVNSLADPGDGTCDVSECTLREAIAFASSGSTITFAPGLTGTITLASSSGLLYVDKSLTINGPGAGVLAISGGDAIGVFWVVGGTSAMSGLTFTHGYHAFSTNTGAIAVDNAGTSLTLTNCAVTNSNGAYQGGGINVYLASLTVSSCTLSGNTASSGGSAIFVYGGTVRILNSTISGNTGAAAVRVEEGGNLGIDHSTITGNNYGVYSYTNTPAVSVKGSIIWGNTHFDVGSGLSNAFASLGHNIVGTAGIYVDFATEFAAAGDQTGVADAKLGALALNSPGTTQTHALLTESPAIDAGVCTDIAGATLSTDQRGVSRPQGSTCDIGAYELPPGGLLDPGFTFDVSTLGTVTYGNGPFGINGFAHTNSSGYISFALGSGSVGCSVSTGGTVTITAAAIDPSHCIIEASVAADATYSGAGPISQSFNIAKAVGSVTISNLPLSAAVGGSFTPTYTKSGDGTASTVSNSTGVCTVTDGVVDFVATGTCLLQASVAEGSNHLAATGSQQSFTVSLAAPTFTFDLSALTAKTFGDGSFSVATYATTNSTGALTFGLGAGSVGCSVTSAGMVTITGAAVDPVHCVLSASVAADGSYAAAGPVKDSVNIAKATSSVSINNMPASATVGDSFTPTYTMSSDGIVSVASLTTGVCTVTSGVVNFIAAGTCTLRASVTEGTNHLAVTGSQQNVSVSALPAVFSSSCTYTINAKNNQRQVTVGWENADPGVTQIQVADGRIVTKQLAPTATGSWSTNLKTGTPTYGLWGGTSRRTNTTTLVDAGTTCVLQ